MRKRAERAHRAFYDALYRQAAAEGIAVIAASGDSGAAACHVAGDTNAVASGYGVNALAATPWNAAVGAAALTQDGTALSAWGPSSPNSAESAFASGGGSSRYYATPRWQSAVGLPTNDPGMRPEAMAGHHRYLPDVSLPGAVDLATGRGLAFCFAGDSGVSGCRLMSGGGSAASAAIFSGIAALLAEKYGAQGNLAPNLYAMRRGDAQRLPLDGALVDVTAGSSRLRCLPGSVDCGDSNQIGFEAAAGYDLATGLGAVNAQALVSRWADPQATGTLKDQVNMTNIGGLTYNPSAFITLAAKVISLSGGSVPTGTIQFYDVSNTQNTGSPVTLAADGTASYTEPGQFSSGGHNIEAIYSGDSLYAPGTSQPVVITIEPSETALVVTVSTLTPASGASVTVTGTLTATNPGDSPPTGTLTVDVDGIAQGTGKFATVGTATTASVNITAPVSGAHAVQGIYSGDSNYNRSTAPSLTITIKTAATVTSISAIPSTLTAGTPETLTATIAPLVAAVGATFTITGTVSFYDGGTTLLGTAPISSNTAVLPAVVLSASAVHTITAVYSGDTSWSPSTSSPLVLEPILLPVTVVLTATSPILAPGQSANLTATVTPVNTPAVTAEQHPTGSVFFYAGTALIGSATLGIGVGDSGVATLAVPALPAGQYVLTALYAGDLTYGTATSNALNLQVEDFTISSTTTNINMVQGTTAQVPFTVTSAGGLTGPIQIVCVEQNPPVNGAIICLFSPSIVDGSGATTLTVITTAGNLSRNAKPGVPGNPLLPAGGGVALALLGVLLSPIGRRAGVLQADVMRKTMVMILLLLGLAGAGMGCTNSVTPGNTTGTPLGVATLKITAAAYVNHVTVSHNAYLTVNVLP